MTRVGRRDWIGGVTACLLSATGASAAPGSTLVFEDLELPAVGKLPRRARLLFAPGSAPSRCLILLHGKGETNSEAAALKAWSHLYGLMDAYARLKTPPVASVLSQPKFNPERIARINRDLAARPFGDLALLCPVTPDPAQQARREEFFDRYSDWLIETLLPTARTRLPSLGKRVGLDGCSMGGYVALEVFLRRAAAFGSFGTVQGAIGQWRVPSYADRFAAQSADVGRRPIHLQTSTHDPFLPANEQLSRKLTERGIQHELDVIEGPHNQPWLRQAGTLEMLRWHERQL